ncbi:MAG: regulator of replication initiation timing [Saprospiraceae bacterium]
MSGAVKKKVAENIEKFMQYIVEELESNKDNLAKMVEYHNIIKVSFDSLRQDLSKEDVLKPYYGNDKFRPQNIKGVDRRWAD